VSDAIEALLAALRPLCAREIGPVARRWDEQRSLDADLPGKLAEWGVLGISVDEAKGGAGAGLVGAAAIVEELAVHSGSLAVRVALHEAAAVGRALALGDDAALATAMAPASLSGWVGPTRLRRGHAGTSMLVAGDGELVVARQTGEGATLGVVAAGTLGVRKRDSSGLRSAGWVDVVEPRGLEVAGPDAAEVVASITARVAVLVGAAACGLARAAIIDAAKYAQVREQFGSPLARFQATQWKIANGATERDAAWSLVTHAAGMLDRHGAARCSTTAGDAAARAQLAAVRAAVGACSDALQIHGGYGYTEEFAVERHLRDARACSAVDRTDHELKEALVPSLVARFA
jgi:hypothetical protein